MNTKVEKIKNWDIITILLLIISALIIIFSFFAPTIFTKPTDNLNLDFTTTGQIGDTLGGIMNPFIALGGVLLTFLAFYMQIKANQIQISQFNQNLQNEKNNKISDEKKSSYYNLSLLAIDLEEILSDISQKSERIKEFINLEKQDNLNTNYLFRTPSKRYSRILETDRIQIYKGFVFFLFQNVNWLEIYSKLYNILEYLPELFETIYSKYENHSSDLFEKKMSLRSELNILMNTSSQLINNHHVANPTTYLNNPEVKICNKIIENYYQLLQQNIDENQNPTAETDFNQINKKVLEPFLNDALFVRNNVANFDRDIEKMIEKVSDLRKDIQLLKNRKLEFAKSLENEYNKLMVDKEDVKSINADLVEIQDTIKKSLIHIKVDEL